MDQLLQHITWTPMETIYFYKKTSCEIEQPNVNNSFSAVIEKKLRNSMLGIFIQEYNKNVQQNKEVNQFKYQSLKSILKNSSRDEINEFVENNNFSTNLFDLLNKTLTEDLVIDKKYVIGAIKLLRLPMHDIRHLDKTLRKFVNLETLILNGNWLSKIRGSCLPQDLKFLELYDNFISDLTEFSIYIPMTLVHIGLGRNKLNDASNLHTLTSSGRLLNLRNLDLSENDLYSLASVLSALQALPHLICLRLEGNPCSTCIGYKDAIVKYLPQILYLDDTNIEERDRKVSELYTEDSCLVNGAIIINCFRVMGLPPPPKDIKCKQTYHFEIELPLLDENERNKTSFSTSTIDIPKVESKEKLTEATSKTSKSSKSSKKNKRNSQDSKSIYDAPDEYEHEMSRKHKKFYFETDRKPWDKIIQFTDPTLVIYTPDNDLKALRDTFRSEVKFKLMFLQWSMEDVRGVSQSERKSSVRSNRSRQNSRKDPIVHQLKEHISKKITITSFVCQLKNINWSDKTIDYYWDENFTPGKPARMVEGSLQSLNYIESLAKPKQDKSGKHKKSVPEPKPSNESLTAPILIPNCLTCQIGIGLKRLYDPTEEHYLTSETVL